MQIHPHITHQIAVQQHALHTKRRAKKTPQKSGTRRGMAISKDGVRQGCDKNDKNQTGSTKQTHDQLNVNATQPQKHNKLNRLNP